jgi:hypothetical protein
VGAALAARHMTAERRCAAVLDGRHHLHLVEADVTGVGAPPRRCVVAEDIYCLLSQSFFGKLSRLNIFQAGPDGSSVPPCSRLSRSGLEALEQAVPSVCRPSLTAARHDGEGLPSRKASMGTLTYPVLTGIYAAICAPFQDWPSRNTALRITMSFRMTAVTTYLKG